MSYIFAKSMPGIQEALSHIVQEVHLVLLSSAMQRTGPKVTAEINLTLQLNEKSF